MGIFAARPGGWLHGLPRGLPVRNMTRFCIFSGLTPLLRAACLAACTSLLLAVPALAQAPQLTQQPSALQLQAQQPVAPPSAAPQAQPEKKPGAMEAFGKWFDESAAGMRKGFDDLVSAYSKESGPGNS